MSMAVNRGPTSASRTAIGHAIERLDYLRRSPFSVGGPKGHKEWQHFVIFGPKVDLLVNFNLCDDVRLNAPAGAELPRIVLLVRTHRWDGDVETFAADDTHVRGGRIDLTFGENRLVFRDGYFEIAVALRERRIALKLTLTPITLPACVPSLAMLDGPPLRWAVVPRLLADGWISVDGVRHAFDHAAAYHDHNWGYFLWGHDVSWEWGFVLPENPSLPWSATFVRLTNRSRSSALAQTVLLWREEHLVGMFREEEVTVRIDREYLKPARVFKVPRVMALVAPEVPTDVPQSVEFRARRDGDEFECHSAARDLAQVLIPAETRLGTTVFNEVVAHSTVRARIAGETVAFEGPSILEFIREY